MCFRLLMMLSVTDSSGGFNVEGGVLLRRSGRRGDLFSNS